MIKRRTAPQPVEVPLRSTRLAAPPLPAGYIERPRLLRMLDTAAHCPVTAVVAPAGWGKTALLSSWVRGDRSSSAWLSLEPGDAVPTWPYLHQALQAAAPGGPELPGPPPEGPVRGYLTELAEALGHLAQPLILVLDNCQHLRRPDLLDGLGFLVHHAGSRLRLVLAGRREPSLPLHRWRLAGELAELAAGELAFTGQEAVALLAQHGLHLPEVRVHELADHAEGWPAGLRLAALSLQRHPGPAAIVAQVSGEDPPLADYFAGEVLAELPEGASEALVSGSVPEWVSGGLLDALAGRTDSEQMLTDLARTGTFVVARATVPPTYRFHRFFREFLDSRLRHRPAGSSPELHLRAASWLAAHGYPAEALGHALRAPAWEYATSLFTSRWQGVIASCQHPAPTLAAAPPPWPAMREHPELALAYAVDCLRVRELGTAEAYLQLAGRTPARLSADRARRLTRMLAAARQSSAWIRAEPHRVRTNAAELSGAAQPDPGAEALALAGLGAAQLAAGELEPAEQTLDRGLTSAEQAGLACTQLACLSELALVRALRGALRQALETALAAFERPPCPGQPPGTHQATAYLAAAVAELQRDHPAEAAAHLASAHALGLPASGATAPIIQAELHRHRGDVTAGYEALRHDLGSRDQTPYARHRLAATEARLDVARGEPAVAAARLDALLREAGTARPEVSVVAAQAQLHAGDAGRAAETLPAWDDEAAVPLALRVEAGVLDAWAAAQRGDRRRCAWALERALHLAAPEGVRRPFTTAPAPVRELLAHHLDSGTAYWSLVNDLLAATRESRPAPPQQAPGQVEPLTDRELTVLRYLQSALSVAEIARELHLSTNTIKTHLRHIYRKLDATGRRETVRQARQLHLL